MAVIWLTFVKHFVSISDAVALCGLTASFAILDRWTLKRMGCINGISIPWLADLDWPRIWRWTYRTVLLLCFLGLKVLVSLYIYIYLYCETTVKQLFMRKTRNATAFQYNLTIGWRTKGRSLGDIGSVDMAVQKVHRRWNSKKNDGEMITLKPSSIATVSEGCRIG